MVASSRKESRTLLSRPNSIRSRYQSDDDQQLLDARSALIPNANDAQICLPETTSRAVGWRAAGSWLALVTAHYTYVRGLAGYTGAPMRRHGGRRREPCRASRAASNREGGGCPAQARWYARAEYQYNSFENFICWTGTCTIAKDTALPFSTNLNEDRTEFVLYGFRFYDPNLQRWPSRDPMGEKGGRNLYAFVANAPSGFVDPLGRCGFSYCGPDYTQSLINEFTSLRNFADASPVPERSSIANDTINTALFYIWFARNAVRLNFDYQARTANRSPQGCPSVECHGTITLCGKCVTSDVPGNIAFGFFARGLMPDWISNIGAFVAELNMFDHDGESREEDYDQFEIGRILYDSGSNDVCSVLDLLGPEKTRPDCHTCTDVRTYRSPTLLAPPNYFGQ